MNLTTDGGDVIRKESTVVGDCPDSKLPLTSNNVEWSIGLGPEMEAWVQELVKPAADTKRAPTIVAASRQPTEVVKH